MAAIKNDRDLALQNAPYRSKQAAVTITGTAGVFFVSKNTTTILPATITLTATPSGSVYTTNAVYTWSYCVNNISGTYTQISSGANLKTLVVNKTDSWVKSSNPIVYYRCVVTEPLLDTSYAFYQISYTAEASDPININLSRTNILITCDSSGVPTSYSNTDQTITVTLGSTALAYSSNTTTPSSFSVSYVASNLTAVAGTGSGTSWVQPAITGIVQDGAYITYTIIVYDSASPPAPTTYFKTVVYNKVNNGTIGADGANLYPVANYDFAGAALPAGVTYTGNLFSADSATATGIQNSVNTQYLRLTNIGTSTGGLSLLPANSYIISMRVKWMSGTWAGKLYYTNTVSAQTESSSYYKDIPQPANGVWTTINLDMRTLTVGGTAYMLGGAISSLRIDLVTEANGLVYIDYITVARYGVSESTKSTTLNMYTWSNSGAPAYSGAFTYTWGTNTVNTYPTGWTSAAPAAPGSGYVLYQRTLVLSDVLSATTTAGNWSASQINTIGYRNDGIGSNGDSYRSAYIITNGAWTAPLTPTSGTGDVAPTSTVTVNAVTTSWSKTAPTAALTDGQYVYQADGILSYSTGNITWSTPYLSNLKVGNLSAISANLGTVQVFTGGALYSGKSTFANNTTAGFFLGNDGGVPKFRIGNATNTQGLSYDTGTGILQLLGGTVSNSTVSNSTVTNSTGTTLLSPTTIPDDILNANLVISPNYCLNGDFSSGFNNWTKGTPSTGASTCTFSSVDVLNLGVGEGSGTVQIAQSDTNATGYVDLTSDGIYLQSGKRYIVSAYIGTRYCKGEITTNFYLGGGGTTLLGSGTNPITNSNAYAEFDGGSYYGGTIIEKYKRIYQVVDIPSNANAVYLTVNIRKYGTDARMTGTYSTLLITRVQVEEVSATTILPSTWKLPGASKTIINNINNVGSTKLNKAAADIMTGPITLSTAGAIQVGTTNTDGSLKTGMFIGSGGIVAKNSAGTSTFTLDNSGNATFGGTLNVVGTGTSRVEVLSDKISVYYNGVLRVRLGNLT